MFYILQKKKKTFPRANKKNILTFLPNLLAGIIWKKTKMPLALFFNLLFYCWTDENKWGYVSRKDVLIKRNLRLCDICTVWGSRHLYITLQVPTRMSQFFNNITTYAQSLNDCFICTLHTCTVYVVLKTVDNVLFCLWCEQVMKGGGGFEPTE